MSNEERPVLSWNSSCGDPLDEGGWGGCWLSASLGAAGVSPTGTACPRLGLLIQAAKPSLQAPPSSAQETNIMPWTRRPYAKWDEKRMAHCGHPPPSLLVTVNSASPTTPDSKETEHVKQHSR